MKRHIRAITIAVATLCFWTMPSTAREQSVLGPEALAARAHAAMVALDRYMETWNSRSPTRWATSLNFPHVRPGPGAFELSQTPEQYAAGIDFNATLKTGWHHSEWTSRRVIQTGRDTVHVAGNWMRYTADDRELTGSAITYVVTNQNGRWGVLSRFAAGPTGLEVKGATENESAARAALTNYFKAFNGHDPVALAATMHFPHVRIAGGAVELWPTIADFHNGSEPGRQRTWYDTRLEQTDVIQVCANGVNIAVTYIRRDRQGKALSQSEALVLVVRRDNAWKVQAISTLGA